MQRIYTKLMRSACACGMLLLLSTPQTWADTLGVDFTGAGSPVDNTDFNLGYQFVANYNAVVTGLATWDNWFNTPGSVQVGLWDAAGDLLTQATVTDTSPRIGHAQWAYSAITPVSLTAGATYYVASVGSDGNYADYTSGFSVSPLITFVQDAFIVSSTLAFPTSTSGITADEGGGYFGGNVILQAIPEPGSLMLLGMGLTAISLVRRRSHG